MAAKTTSRIDITVVGERFICDNSDVLHRCEKLLARTQCFNKQKGELWDLIKETKKYYENSLWFSVVYGLKTKSLFEAIEEMLTLTQE